MAEAGGGEAPDGGVREDGAKEHQESVTLKKPNANPSANLDDITNLLEDSGLDSDYWLELLREKFGMTKIKQFKFLRKGKRQTEKVLECARYDWETDALEEFIDAIETYFNNPTSEAREKENPSHPPSENKKMFAEQTKITQRLNEPTSFNREVEKTLQERDIIAVPTFLLGSNLPDINRCAERFIESKFEVLPISDGQELDNLFQINYESLQFYDIFKNLIGVECASTVMHEITDSDNNILKFQTTKGNPSISGNTNYIAIPTFEINIDRNITKLSSLATHQLQKLNKSIEISEKTAQQVARETIELFGSHFISGKLIWGSLLEVVMLTRDKEDKKMFQKVAKQILSSMEKIKHLGSEDGEWMSAAELLRKMGINTFKSEDVAFFKIRITYRDCTLLQVLDIDSSRLLDLSMNLHPIWSTLEHHWHQVPNVDTLKQLLAKEWKDMVYGIASTEEGKEADEITLENMLETFELTNYYPNKIGVNDVMRISEIKRHKDTKDLPWILMQQLIMMDHGCRDVDISTVLDDRSVSPHPLDLLITVYMCCDPMLQQLIAKKMFLCRIAIPFVFHSKNHILCSVWPLENLTMEWRNANDEACEAAFTRHDMHIVSCIRFGRPGVSKSKLLNKIVSDKQHDVFYHSDKPGGINAKNSSNGMIEISHYLPACKENDVLTNELIIMNLRGDLQLFEEQVKFLVDISSVVLVIVDVDDMERYKLYMNDMAPSQGKNTWIHLITCRSIPTKDDYAASIQIDSSFVSRFHCTFVPTFIPSTRIKGSHEIKTELRKQICDNMKVNTGNRCSLKEHVFNSEHPGILVDEDIFIGCKEGKEFSKQLLKDFNSRDVAGSKSSLLPLQGELWHEWGKLQKNKSRIVSDSDDKDLSKKHDGIQRSMDELRRKQSALLEKSYCFIGAFAEFVQANIGGNGFLFALHWLKQALDDISRDILPSLQVKYKIKWDEYNGCSNKLSQGNPNDTAKDLKKIEQDIFNSAFGLEHILRELGQLYEVSLAASNRERANTLVQWQHLPNVATSLLVSGVPLEIMDGDAASVPLTWVKAVFQNLKDRLGDKRVFIISVVGIQSSGKSTLLNTMFGLEFAVSAGRCTRGIFAQLLPVADGSNLPFDYILLLDSEGLRAPELGNEKYQHDNELATFVIGLADLTLINLKGENTAEMRDVLQIAVHAFLRMKLADKTKRQRCVFVHQNVAALNAKEKMMFGQKKLQESLDQMTREAAQAEENCNISSFNDVIEFDGQQHVWYFSDLWSGDPPMAPINTGYSAKAAELRTALIQRLIDTKPSCVTFGNLIIRIEDMWKAVLADDFVFSFRNSLAIKAHLTVEELCSKIKHDIDTDIAKWRIGIQPQIYKCVEIQKLNATFQNISLDLEKIVLAKLIAMEEELNHFFQQSEFKDILLERQEQYITSMRNSITREIHKVKRELDTLNLDRSNILQQTKNIEHSQENLIKAAIDLAQSFKGKSTDPKAIDEEFGKLWNSTVKTESVETSTQTRNTLRVQLESVFLEVFTQSKAKYIMEELERYSDEIVYNGDKLAGSVTTQHLQDQPEELINVMSFSEKFRRMIGCKLKSEHIESAVNIINGIYANVDTHLERISSQNSKFLGLHANEFVRILYEEFNSHNQRQDSTKILLTTQCIARFCVFAAPLAVRKFESMNARYEQVFGYKAELEVQRKRIYTLFINQVNQTTDNCNTADLFGDIIKSEVEKVTEGNTTVMVTDELMQNFSHNKYHLIVKIMEDLCQEEKYDNFKEYIRDSHGYAYKWLKKFVNKWCFNRANGSVSRYSELFKGHINVLFKKVIACVKNAFKMAYNADDEDKKNTLIEAFCTEIDEYLTITPRDMTIVSSQNLSDYQNLEDMILRELDKVQVLLHTKVDGITEETVVWRDCNPLDTILKKLWGCKKQCMYCHEPCMMTDPKHKTPHQSIQHRLEGVCGFRYVQNLKLSTFNCNFNVCSNRQYMCRSYSCRCGNGLNTDIENYHNYKEYKKYRPTWDIAPDPSGEASEYWKWVMCKFNWEIAAHFEVKQADIPPSWHRISKEEALNSLRKYVK